MVPVNRMNLTNNPIDKTFSDTNNTSNFQTENMKHKKNPIDGFDEGLYKQKL